jgi:5-formyltetrahydrofolate cyclo-ligase
MTEEPELTKLEVRKYVLLQRASLTAAERRRKSSAIAKRLFTLPEYLKAGSVLFFVGFDTEVITLPMLDQALRQRKTVIAPRLKKGRSGEMELRCLSDLPAQLAPGALGILEPDETCPMVPLEEIDLIIVPAVAWDETGHRVGYGGGFYDRLLARAAEKLCIGIGFDCQVLPQVPRDTHDLGVDMLITETRLLKFK